MTNSELKHAIQKVVRRKLLEMSSNIPESFEDFRIRVSDILRAANAPVDLVEEVGFSRRESYSFDATWLTWNNIQLEVNSSPGDYRNSYSDISKEYIARLISDVVRSYNQNRATISEMIDPKHILEKSSRILNS